MGGRGALFLRTCRLWRWWDGVVMVGGAVWGGGYYVLGSGVKLLELSFIAS